jgi:NAD+-dependent protein deacetylase sirtuin 4
VTKDIGHIDTCADAHALQKGAMGKPLMRIPYTDVFPSPHIIPKSADTLRGAIAALQEFFTASPPRGLPSSTVVLTGAGLSVASGLAD